MQHNIDRIRDPLGGGHQVKREDLETRLEVAVDELDDALTQATAEMTREFPEFNPLLMKDNNNRYILLDAMVSLVNGLAVLVK